MAISLDDVTPKASRKTKSLLDMVLDRKEARYKARSKKKTLRPWQNFRDEVADDRYYKKKSSVMKSFATDTCLTDDERMQQQITEKAHELFYHMDKEDL